MTGHLIAEISGLNRLTVKELRARYAEVFGERTEVGNKTWLVRRLAWRLQSLVEGDLSERARRRAAELAQDADVRLTPPRQAPLAATTSPCSSKATVAHTSSDNHNGRLPSPGTVITRLYKGKALHVHVLADGFAYDGGVYKSLSAVAKAITGSHCNGFQFFRLTRHGGKA